MNKIWDETMLQFELPAPPENDAGAAREVRSEPAAGELHFRELLNLLRRRRRSILAITFCGSMLAFAIGLLIPAEIYREGGNRDLYALERRARRRPVEG